MDMEVTTNYATPYTLYINCIHYIKASMPEISCNSVCISDYNVELDMVNKHSALLFFQVTSNSIVFSTRMSTLHRGQYSVTDG